jgi:hypothetical protein
MGIHYTNCKRHVAFFVDDEDDEIVSNYTWRDADYIVRTPTKNEQHMPKTIRLHIFLMGKAPDGLEWDHIDRDKTNCRRLNLRAVSSLRNSYNRDLDWDNLSGYSGVTDYWPKGFRARIMHGRKNIHLGVFDTFEEAKAARIAAELKYWGIVRTS